MSVTLIHTSSIRDQAGATQSLSGAVNYAGNTNLVVDKILAASQTDSALSGAFAHATVVLGYLIADHPCTVESGSDSISLLAGVPVLWVGGADSDPFTADVTAMTMTTPSGFTVHLQGFILLP